jgi:cystathionine beta-lyase/cystathionine gamma-synthase
MKSTPVIPPVTLSATYRFDRTEDLIDVVQHRSGYIYSRWDNPTVVEVESQLAAMEGYDHAIGFGSGMAAITTAIMSQVRAGDRIVATRELYGGTFELLGNVLAPLGVETVFVNCEDTDGLLTAVADNPAVVYLESPTNPLLRVIDIAPIAEAARARGAVVMLDATFASPGNQDNRSLGVDVVIHSATKYLGGHHDVTGGFACCNSAYFDRIWTYRKILGGVMDPMSAFLVRRGMQTLPLRIQQQTDNAMAIAAFLDGHPAINAVHYPGLTGHPDHETAERQMSGFGGMLSFEVNGGFEDTAAVMDRLKAIKLATSLGGVTSLANQPITNTHAALKPEDRAKAGVKENLVRLSVGIEPAADLIADLDQALEIV